MFENYISNPIPFFLDNNVIHPLCIYKLIWDFFIAACVVFSIILVPIKYGFNIHAPAIEFFDAYIIPIIFFIDLGLNFNVAYTDETEEYITDRKKIAKRYFGFYFWIDLLSAFPFHLIFSGNAAKTLQFTDILKAVKLSHLFGILKLLHENGFFSSISLRNTTLRLVSTVFVFCTFIHFMVCFWYSVGSHGPDGNSWVKKTCFIINVNDGDCISINNLSFKYQYLTTLYFVLTLYLNLY